jgi:DNA (cytosine-5)-methyltransferase 1
MKKTLRVADLFCGAGGFSTALMSVADEFGVKIKLTAVNHWETAIATHSANHPKVKHLNQRIETLHPWDVVPGRRLDLLLASPECIHFSNARGSAPVDDQSRHSGWDVLRWLEALDIRNLIIENVPEYEDWGPTIRVKRKDKKTGRMKYVIMPDKKRKGETFKQFIEMLKSLGYKVEHRKLVAADYGSPQTRKRLFILASKDRRPNWPEPTHSKLGVPSLFFPTQKWKTARDHVIDWSLEGKSIFLPQFGPRGNRYLVPNTMRRIIAGVKKFGGISIVPFFGERDGQGARTASTDEPMPTVTATGHQGLAQVALTPFMLGQQSQARPRDVGSPVPTVATAGGISLVQPFILQMEHGGVLHPSNEPMPTITSADGFAYVEPFITTVNHGDDLRAYSVDGAMPSITGMDAWALIESFLVNFNGNGRAHSINSPLDTVTTNDRFGLVVILANGEKALLDIRFRMIQPHELARAQSFPRAYKFTGSRKAVVKQIGNAVDGEQAKSLIRSAIFRA